MLLDYADFVLMPLTNRAGKQADSQLVQARQRGGQPRQTSLRVTKTSDARTSCSFDRGKCRETFSEFSKSEYRERLLQVVPCAGGVRRLKSHPVNFPIPRSFEMMGGNDSMY